MKYIITESQYQNLISEQTNSPFVGKKSTKGNFIISKFDITNSDEFKPSLYPSNPYMISIDIKNISQQNLTLIIESVNFSDENRVSDLVFTKEPLPVNYTGKIAFYLTPSNTMNSEVTNNLFITINASVVNKNVKDSLTIDFSYKTKPSSSRFDVCKKTFNQQELQKSVDWFKRWLSNPVTKEKFAKSFNYSMKNVEKHFSNYFRILNQLKLEFTQSNDDNSAWVRQDLLQTLGFKPGGFEVPITINCRLSARVDEKKVQETLIHEIQHILSYYHKLHPFRDDIFTFYSNKLEELIVSDANVPQEKIIDLLKKEGFKDVGAKKVAEFYTWMLKNDYEHLNNGTEKLSALYEVRKNLRLVPGQEITKQMLIKNYREDSVIWLLSIWLNSGDSLDEFIKEQNSIALNQNKKQTDVGSV